MIAEKVRDPRQFIAQLPEGSRAYAPRGAALEVFRDRSGEIILDGPAGTGKTRAILEKLDALAEKYPGMRGLIVRKTRSSLTQTALVTFETHVLGPGTPVAFHTPDQEYRYPNGSRIAIAGMDKDIKVMSAEFDIIVGVEATEFSEAEWEALTTRLRNGIVPYQQIIADCNPSEPRHWIRQRAARGDLRMIASRHVDNPVLFDPITGTWTPKGQKYMEVLRKLTGVRRQRLYEGLWVQAEGAIYTDWDRAEHLVDLREIPGIEIDDDDVPRIPAAWPRYWTIDFGYINPFVWQAWAKGPDNELYLYREIYKTRTLVEDLAAEIGRETAGDPRPVEVLCDHDAEGRATLERHLDIITTAACKTVSPGIQAVQARLRARGNGRRGLYIVRDALVSIDKDLQDRKLPFCTADELEGYTWDTRQGRRQGETPLKENDHGSDALRYLVAEIDDIKGLQSTAEHADFSVLDL